MDNNYKARLVEAMEKINTLSNLKSELAKKMLVEDDEETTKKLVAHMYQLAIDIEELLKI